LPTVMVQVQRLKKHFEDRSGNPILGRSDFKEPRHCLEYAHQLVFQTHLLRLEVPVQFIAARYGLSTS